MDRLLRFPLRMCRSPWYLVYVALGLVLMMSDVSAQSSIGRAVHAAGQLWLLELNGKLSRIADGSNQRLSVATSGPVLDICTRDEILFVATCPAGKCEQWTIHRREARAWTLTHEIAVDHDELQALVCAPDQVLLLTTRRLIAFSGKSSRIVQLSEPGEELSFLSVQLAKDDLYVGINRGEFGGGLRKIDQRTGKVTTISHVVPGRTCKGMLDAECDPVMALEPVPWNPACVAVAVGLVHRSLYFGRVLELCGETVRALYVKRQPPAADSAEEAARHDEWEKQSGFVFSAPIYGLKKMGPRLLAFGLDGIHDIHEDGSAIAVPMPKFHEVGGAVMSDQIPGVYVVLTDANNRFSLGVGAPMIVSRSPSIRCWPCDAGHKDAALSRYLTRQKK